MHTVVSKALTVSRRIASGLIVGTVSFLNTPALAGDVLGPSIQASFIKIDQHEAMPAQRNVRLGLNKSLVIELPRDVREIVVSSPEIMDGLVHSSRRAYLIGKKQGQANAFFFDKSGRRILTIEVEVQPDTRGMTAIITRMIPGSNVSVEAAGRDLILTGSVPHAKDAARASQIAKGYLGEGSKVHNMIAVQSEEQVMIKVTIAEMQRDVIKRLNVNWNGVGVGGTTNSISTNYLNPITSATAGGSSFASVSGTDTGSCKTESASVFGASSEFASAALGLGALAGLKCISSQIDLLERNGLIRTLAEPTLTSISGETASFLAGGEFPVPVGQDDNKIIIEFKQFGVGVTFTPVVMSPKRISLRVETEVSELSTDGAIQLSTLQIPALRVRRAKTTVELPSGGSIVLAGLISDDTKQNIDGTPGLKNLPILGTLFRSRDYRRRETELVMIATPYMVKSTQRSNLGRPDDGFAPASDAKANFLGQLNRVYGRTQAMPVGDYKGDYGFIVE